jgi:hypothetical protein
VGRLGGIDLCVIARAQFDRIEPCGLGQLVHCDLQRHQPWHLAGYAHRLSLCKIERRQIAAQWFSPR